MSFISSPLLYQIYLCLQQIVEWLWLNSTLNSFLLFQPLMIKNLSAYSNDMKSTIRNLNPFVCSFSNMICFIIFQDLFTFINRFKIIGGESINLINNKVIWQEQMFVSFFRNINCESESKRNAPQVQPLSKKVIYILYAKTIIIYMCQLQIVS